MAEITCEEIQPMSDRVEDIALGEAVRDIVNGATNPELMDKYGLSQEELFSLFDRLVNTKYITRVEIGGRKGPPQKTAGSALSRGVIARIVIAAIFLASPLLVLLILPWFIGHVPLLLFMLSGAFVFGGGMLLRIALPNKTGWRWLLTVLGSTLLAGPTLGYGQPTSNPVLEILIGIPLLIAGLRTSVVVAKAAKGAHMVRCTSCGGETPFEGSVCIQCGQSLA
jgi:hypothetical protein